MPVIPPFPYDTSLISQSKLLPCAVPKFARRIEIVSNELTSNRGNSRTSPNQNLNQARSNSKSLHLDNNNNNNIENLDEEIRYSLRLDGSLCLPPNRLYYRVLDPDLDDENWEKISDVSNNNRY